MNHEHALGLFWPQPESDGRGGGRRPLSPGPHLGWGLQKVQEESLGQEEKQKEGFQKTVLRENRTFNFLASLTVNPTLSLMATI